MGQDQSKHSQETSQYGGIFMKLDKDAFTPGDTVTGNVYLDLKKPYPGDKLCFEIKGEEYTKWTDREARTRPRPDGTQETYYVDVVREGKFDILKQEITVYDWKAGMIIPPGQYNFPISFLVPRGLPGSFFLMRNGTIAEIAYKVQAYLKPEVESVARLTHKTQVIVRENPPTNIESREVNISKVITTCCCISKGTINMKSSFEKTAYTPGEEARLINEIDNSECTLPITDISFSLQQTVTLSAGPHSRSFGYNIKHINLGSVQPGEKFVGNTAKIGSILLPPGQEGSSKQFRGDAQISENTPDPTQIITPSTNGRIVRSNFSLLVACGMDGCFCCDSMPATSIPVTIYAAKRAPIPDPQPPAGWRPQEMPAANLTITIVQRADGGQDIIINQGGQAAQPNQNQMVQPSMNNQQPYSQPQPNYNNQQVAPQPNYQQPPPNNQYGQVPPQQNYQQPPPQYQNNQYGQVPPQQNYQQPPPQYQNNQMGEPQPNYQQQPQPYNGQPQYYDPNMQNNQQYGQPQPMYPQQVNVQQRI